MYESTSLYTMQTIVLLMFAATILVGIAQKLRIPYPIALVLGGAAISFLPPAQQPITYDPNLLLVIVLPPIIYSAAFGIAFREFTRNWRTIFSLALGLVVVTTVVIGVLFKWLFPDYPWALAFAFGAIVSPPDAAAATAVLKRFQISSRLLTILEGESLVNDATALVLYRLAVIAILSGTFSLAEGAFEFVKIGSGGIALGVVLGFAIQKFSSRYLEPVVGVVFSFIIPYITFIFANYLGVSGVLAVVTVGLIGSRVIHSHHSSLRRVLGYATWDIFVILMNCFVFILIGLQMHTLVQEMSNAEIIRYVGYAVLITAVMLMVRMAWVYAQKGPDYLRALGNPHPNRACSQVLKEAGVIGWSGMRGIVSLTAALALPFVLPDGTPLEGREIAIFMTFMVILITLLLPGLTLPSLIHWLKIDHAAPHFGVHRVAKQLGKVAQDTLDELQAAQTINEEEYNFLHTYFLLQRLILTMSSHTHKKLHNLETARHKVIHAQRAHLLEMWNQQQIDDVLLTHLEQQLDVEETHIARAELK